MYILSKDGRRTQLANLRESLGLVITEKGIEAIGQSFRVVPYLNSDYNTCVVRLNDIIEALVADTTLYDTTAPVGAWKKTGRKKVQNAKPKPEPKPEEKAEEK